MPKIVFTQDTDQDRMYQKKWERTLKYCRPLQEIGKIYGFNTLDDLYVTSAMVLQESGGDPTIINPDSGAVGLMQVMPRDGKAATNSCHCFWDRPSIAELQVDTFNLDFALNFLRQKVDQEDGSIRDGLFRYGTSGVGYAGYADIILGLRDRIKNANK